MSYSDPIADLITRIRNAQKANMEVIHAPASKMRLSVLEVLKREGYIRDYSEVEGSSGHKEIKVELKYVDHEPVIQHISKVSKPGRRVYTTVEDMPKILNGLGILVMSTSRGMLSDFEARQANVGGEIVCKVY